MYHYDFDDFIRRVKDLEYHEMIRVADREAAAVEYRLHGRGKTAQAKQAAGGRDYRRLLGGFLYLLSQGTKPDGVDDWDFPRMRPAIESLVQRQILRAEALNVFSRLAAAGR